MLKVSQYISNNALLLLSKAEQIFTVASLVLYTNAVIPLLIIQGASEGDGVDITTFDFSILNLLFVLNYLVVFSLLFLRWQKVLHFISQNLLFLGFMLIVPLSFAWSAAPDRTLTGSIGMIGTTMFGLYIASRFTLKEQLKLVAWAFGIVVVLSILFIVALPQYGIMGGVHAGAPRGVFTHKNGLGKFMVLSLMAFLLLVTSPGSKKLIPWLGIAASAGLIIASASAGALLNGVMLTVIVLLSSQVFRLRLPFFVSVFLLSILLALSVIVWFTEIATPVLDLFERDLTLTGRTDIWPAVIQKIQERPWLGYGFSGFWHGTQGESADVIRTLRWRVPDSHNGFLDLALQLGLVGSVVFALVIWLTLIKSVALVKMRFCPEYLWPVVLLSYAFIVNFSESTLLAQNSFFWILLSSAVISVSTEFKNLISQPEELAKQIKGLA
ncbi:O-antigen ligase [Nodosilinea sp. P-1105]|uniref:O-antigen ligase family protein n=1 Tax=Nodosilinea sp. P-1105 TaxID=2546229 RepID=UPI00146E2BA6|nr:O-antigen ligase [Nodosilinea sp. P-1105]NMF82564.1 O-antigen ligase family protein [Nodosilinea sp. P-1105]